MRKMEESGYRRRYSDSLPAASVQCRRFFAEIDRFQCNRLTDGCNCPVNCSARDRRIHRLHREIVCKAKAHLNGKTTG